MHKHCEEDEYLWEVEDESVSKVVAIQFMESKCVLLKESLVIRQSLFWKHLLPELKLHYKVKND